jgi:hypothetical protein
MYIYGERLWDLPAAIDFAKWFYENRGVPGVRMTSAYDDKSFEVAKSFVIVDLLLPVWDYLRRGGPIAPIDTALLDSSWLEICQLSARPNVRRSFLIGGVTVHAPLDLGQFGILEPLSCETKTEHFKDHWWEMSPCPIEAAAACQVQLTPAADSAIDFNRAATVVLTALRLLVQPRIYGWGPVVTRISNRLPSGMSYSPIRDFETPPRNPGDIPFANMPAKGIDLLPANRLATVCRLLHEGALDRFRIGFRRFNQSLRRSDLDDRIVDLAIVIESTVLAGVENELFWRAQVLGAELLRDEMDRGEARNLIRALYTARSKIVHEGLIVADAFAKKTTISKELKRIAQNSIEFDEKMVELIRAVLLATLERYDLVADAKEFTSRLEESLFGGRPFSRRAV